jgi:hypothetical protein
MTMMFQDLARGKLKERRLFNFMTAFIIKLLDLYPGEIKKKPSKVFQLIVKNSF